MLFSLSHSVKFENVLFCANRFKVKLQKNGSEDRGTEQMKIVYIQYAHIVVKKEWKKRQKRHFWMEEDFVKSSIKRHYVSRFCRSCLLYTTSSSEKKLILLLFKFKLFTLQAVQFISMTRVRWQDLHTLLHCTGLRRNLDYNWLVLCKNCFWISL